MHNSDLLARSLSAVWHPCTQMKHHETLPLVPVARAEGVWLYDFDGNRYLDAVSSWWVNLFGHANPRINAALKTQLDQLEHVILAGFTHEPVVQLSERLSALTGLGHAFYGSDGASATEIALKMSFHFWLNIGKSEKTEFISLQNSYHGETVGALSLTDVTLFKETYAPLLRQSIQVPSPDGRLAAPGETAEAYAQRCLDALERQLQEHHGKTAAFILEPLVQGAAGMAMYPPSYVSGARALCDRYDVHLIADEIAVGFGRTGTMFACDQAGVRPDFICLSKGITGGYLPLSVVLTTDMVYRAFYDDRVSRGFLHSHSYSGNALACRAALAVLDIFEQEDVLEKNRVFASSMTEALAPVLARGRVTNFRHLGMIWAFEAETADPQFGRKFYEVALKEGILLRPIGNTIYLMPPYVVGDDEMTFLVNRLSNALAKFNLLSAG